MARSTESTKRPKEESVIVWRFRGDKGWGRGYVREVYASGKVIEISANLAFDLVSVCDIEWHYA